MDKEHEEQMINNFRSEMEAKIKEKEREQQEEKNEKIKEKKAEEAIEAVTEQVAAVETVETEPAPAKEISGDIKVEVHATAVHHDQQLEPKIAHAQAHEISHSQAVSIFVQHI